MSGENLPRTRARHPNTRATNATCQAISFAGLQVSLTNPMASFSSTPIRPTTSDQSRPICHDATNVAQICISHGPQPHLGSFFQGGPERPSRHMASFFQRPLLGANPAKGAQICTSRPAPQPPLASFFHPSPKVPAPQVASFLHLQPPGTNSAESAQICATRPSMASFSDPTPCPPLTSPSLASFFYSTPPPPQTWLRFSAPQPTAPPRTSIKREHPSSTHAKIEGAPL